MVLSKALNGEWEYPMIGSIRIPLIFAALLAVLFMLQEVEIVFRGEIRGLFNFAEQYKFLILYPLNGFVTFLTGAIPFALIEMTSPGRKNKGKSIRRYLLPILIWVGYYALSTLVVIITVTLKKVLPQFTALPTDSLPLGVVIILYILLIDFFGYWFHRLEHAVPFLWKFHSTHHSLQDINAFNQYGHWFEGMFRFFIVFLPVSLLIYTPNMSASYIAVIWGTWTLYVHTDAPELCLPNWSRYLFVDNLFHHYHHGKQKKYYDKNFGFFLSIWDHLFGTGLLPKDGQFPETGLDDVAPPTGLVDYLGHPFNQTKGD